jgi:hypothetical protein
LNRKGAKNAKKSVGLAQGASELNHKGAKNTKKNKGSLRSWQGPVKVLARSATTKQFRANGHPARLTEIASLRSQ